MTSSQDIRVRIAPSPTGPLHLGTARTALFNYLFARKNGGKFILRIEDTDIERSEKKYEKEIINYLKWLGIQWDKGPYRQSERLDIYQKYIKQLLDSGQAFWCYHTPEELAREKEAQMKRGEGPRHLCQHKDRPPKTKKGGIIRFRCPDEKIFFDDLIRGHLEFDGRLLGDISIAKDERTPLYNFSVVIDDYEMKMSHVIRGEDHISNTPKQILIGQALGFLQPQFAHLPLILGPDKSKLSKRHGAVSVSWYKKEGYLPEALVNFMVLLGWNPGTTKEFFSLKELAREFSLERVQKGGAIFNLQRLDWLNGYYIRQMDLDDLTKKCLPYLESSLRGVGGDKAIPFDYAKKIVALEQERLKKLSEIGDLTKFFFLDKLDYPAKLLIWKKMTLKEVKNNLDTLEETLSKMDKFDRKSLEGTLMPLAKKHGSGELLWPLRVALTGQKASPPPFEIAEILGKEKTLKRIIEAKARIK
jgi:glutamyl-tRNA synthetase